jgi:L-serine dehydratase
MSTSEYPDFFNHVFGPIMQPGSSSEFAGPVRIGNVARALVRRNIKEVTFGFSKEGKDSAYLVNFMSDRGYLGGILGLSPEDERLFDAVKLAQDERIAYNFYTLPYNNPSLNAVTVNVEGVDGERGILIADSTGGGMIQVLEINAFPVEWTADSYAVLIEDPERVLDHDIVHAWAHGLGDNLLSVASLKRPDGALGFFVETSAGLERNEFIRYLGELPGVRVIQLPALLPVVRTNARQPQLFTTVGEWRQVAEERGISFVQAAIEYEKGASGWGQEQVWAYFEYIAGILEGQIHALERLGYENVLDTPLLPVYGRLWDHYTRNRQRISDDLTNHILIHAFSTNAKIPGVKLVPGPMGTGGGYLFSAVDAVREKNGYRHEKVVEALVVAAALGALAFTHTHVNGNAGCVAESGVCCAMTAGALVWLAGGDGVQVENAASMALQASIGIPCDPIPGGLEFPCLTRTFRAAVSAPMYADLALCGIDPLIPYHEMLQEIERTFQEMSHLYLCSTQTGCCRTPAAKECFDRLDTEAARTLHYTPA